MFDDGGTGSLSDIVAGIEYADTNGAGVISMSLGGPASDLEGTYAFGSGDAPHVSAFEVVFVFAEDDGTLPAFLYANPTKQALYEAVGLSWTVGSTTPMLASIPEEPTTDQTSDDATSARHPDRPRVK